MEKIKLSIRLKHLRYERNITQFELGKALGISKVAVSSYETNSVCNKLPSLQTLIKLANYFDVSSDYLLGLTDNDSPLSECVIQLPLSTNAEQYSVIKKISAIIEAADLPCSDSGLDRLPHKIKMLRLKSGVPQEQLAAALSFQPSSVSAYESGIHLPRVDTIVLIAEFFGVSTDYLLGLSDSPHPLHDKNEPPYSLKLRHNVSSEQVKLIQRLAIEVTECTSDK
jgi:transcriptional regulator with XRE-family HTH domain